MNHISRIAISFIFLFFLCISSSAQVPISAEKSKLIGEIVVVMKMDQQFPQMMDAILAEMEKTYPLGFNSALDANDKLTAKEKSLLRATMNEQFKSFSSKFRKRLAEKVDYGEYIREAVYPLYDKFYTEPELKDLLVFYRTPTGQKLVETLPAFFAEANRLSTEKFVPKIIPIVQELLKEEFDQIGEPRKPKGN